MGEEGSIPLKDSFIFLLHYRLIGEEESSLFKDSLIFLTMSPSWAKKEAVPLKTL